VTADLAAGRRPSHLAEPPDRAPAWRDRVIVAGVALVAAATVLRTVLLNRTWFWFDDYALVNTPAQDGLTGHDLIEPYFSHLMPGGRFLSWLVVQGPPYTYGIAVAEIIVFYAAAGLAMLYLLVTLFGRRAAVLLPLVYFLLSPFLTSAMSWWCVGINHIPALLASCMALATHVRYVRGEGGNRTLAASIGWIVFGLVFAELTLYVYLPMLVITLGYFASGSIGARVGQVWDRYRTAVVAHVVLGCAYLAVFYQLAWTTVPAQDKPDWSAFIGNASLTMFPTVAIGGPGTWHTAWSAQFETDPSGLVRLLGLVALGTLLSLAALTRERAMRAWLIPLAQLGLSIALVGKARVVFGPGIATDVRFFASLALGMALAMALAFLPVIGAVESSETRTEHWALRPGPLTAVFAVYAAFAVSSASAYPLLHLDKPPKAWFDAVESSLAAADRPVDLVDMTTPDWIMGPPEAYYSRALAQMDDQVRFPEVVQDDFYVLDDEGALVRPELDVVRSATTPAPADCGYPVPTDRTVPLDGPVFGYGWRVRVTYTAAADTGATISLGEVDTDVSLLAGEHVLELPGNAEYDGVRFSGVDAASDVCVSELVVGTTQIPGRPPL